MFVTTNRIWTGARKVLIIFQFEIWFLFKKKRLKLNDFRIELSVFENELFKSNLKR